MAKKRDEVEEQQPETVADQPAVEESTPEVNQVRYAPTGLVHHEESE